MRRSVHLLYWFVGLTYCSRELPVRMTSCPLSLQCRECAEVLLPYIGEGAHPGESLPDARPFAF